MSTPKRIVKKSGRPVREADQFSIAVEEDIVVEPPVKVKRKVKKKKTVQLDAPAIEPSITAALDLDAPP